MIGLSMREQAVELARRRAVRVLARRLHLEEIDDVDEPHLEIRQVLAQDRRRRQRFLRRYVAARGHHDVRLLALVVARAIPDADALRAVHDGLVDRRELQVLLLVGDDDVDAVGRAQALIGHDEQSVRIRREVDAA